VNSGQQIIDNCRDIAARQYAGDLAGAARCEIELLRTKVLELSAQVARSRAGAEAQSWFASEQREAEPDRRFR
jgi:hypothetical protein